LMSHTVSERAVNFGVTAHPHVGRRLGWGYHDSAGIFTSRRAPSLHFRLNHHTAPRAGIANNKPEVSRGKAQAVVPHFILPDPE
jgi:hypothetical protein